MRVRHRFSSAALLLSLAASGCGYTLVGKGVVVDPTIKRVGVPLFRDATGKSGLDRTITRSVVEELLRRGHFDVVSDSKGVDALVEGELLSYRVAPVGFSAVPGEGGAADPGTSQATRYQVTVRARIRYAKVGESEPIFVNDAFQFQEEYELGADPTAFFDREEQAVDRLAEAFARKLVADMLEAF